MKKQELKELIIEAVQDATDTETGMVSIPVLDALLDEIIPELSFELWQKEEEKSKIQQ